MTIHDRNERYHAARACKLAPQSLGEEMDGQGLALIHRLDAVEANAYRAMFAAAPDALGLDALEVGDATLLIAKGLPVPMFNRVIGLGNSSSANKRVLDNITDAYRAVGIRNWWIHVSPGARPDALAQTLEARGFTRPPRRSWAKLWRGNEPAARLETDLEVRALKRGEERAFGATLAAAFEMPPSAIPWFATMPRQLGWRAVAAFDQGRMIGGGLLHLQGENAWLGAGGVRPEARRKRAHRALILARVRLAIEEGARHLVTETGEQIGDEANPSLRNMLACGFAKIFSRDNHAAPA
jgi:GNAT superfamily N-acetyltransferase